MRLFRKTKESTKPEVPTHYARLVRSIQGALSLDLRHPNYPVEESEYEHATKGHCYVATEAAYHLFARDAGYVPYMRKHEDGTTHWWLQHQETGEILDPTQPQHGREPYPYERGKRRAFLTKKPSRRAAELIRRVQAAQVGRKHEPASGETQDDGSAQLGPRGE